MFMIDRRYFRYFDWLSFFLTITLSTIGLLFVFSTTYKPTAPFSTFFQKQLFGIASGIIIYFVFCSLDYRWLCRWGYFLYFAIIALLIFTTIKGSIGMGAQRWINVGLFKFQPSELAKLFLPAFMSYYFLTQNESSRYTFGDFIPIFFMLGISFLLIRKQPDLGTAIIILITGLTMIWLAGLSKNIFFAGIFVFIVCTPLTWHFLKPYQKQRVLVFLGQGSMYKERYQIEQSKIAIGSGGISGKGFLKGTQNTFMFLPESRTDFIFAVLCEEWGFIGAILVILLFMILFLRILLMIMTLPDLDAQILATGLLTHIIFSTIINTAMVTGLLPIVGIPLPLMSYGISHLWITFASLGWLNGISIARSYSGIR